MPGCQHCIEKHSKGNWNLTVIEAQRFVTSKQWLGSQCVQSRYDRESMIIIEGKKKMEDGR
jgi:hypothetical protein